MDVNTPVAVVIDIIVFLAAGTCLQGLKHLGRTKAYPSIASKVLHLKNEKLIGHFSKQLWQLTWHGGSFILMLAVMVPSDFWPSIINPYGGTELLWEYSDNGLPPTGIRALYLIQIGYYVTDFIYMWVKDKPNDIYIMSGHHIAAESLLWMSYLPPPGWKIGCAVLWVHEIGDVSLALCKTLHYGQFELTSNILFIIHIMIWIWSRLIWLPRIILSFYAYEKPDIWQIWPCGILLWALFILHAYWCYLMLKVLYKAVFEGKAMADDRDKDNPMKDREINDENENNGGRKATFDDDIVDGDQVNLDDMQPMEIVADRTDNLDDGPDNKPPMMRRRSSLMGSFIESKENIVTPSNNP